MSDATATALFVNSVNNTIVISQTQLYTTILVGSAGGAGGFTMLYKIVEKLIGYFFEKRRNSAITKSNLGEEVLKFCAEGEQAFFQSPPRDSEHIAFVANKLQKVNNTVSIKLKYYLYAWQMRTSDVMPKELYKQLEDEINRTREELVKLVSSW